MADYRRERSEMDCDMLIKGSLTMRGLMRGLTRAEGNGTRLLDTCILTISKPKLINVPDIEPFYAEAPSRLQAHLQRQ